LWNKIKITKIYAKERFVMGSLGQRSRGKIIIIIKKNRSSLGLVLKIKE
jgi:hypothetical protein